MHIVCLVMTLLIHHAVSSESMVSRYHTGCPSAHDFYMGRGKLSMQCAAVSWIFSTNVLCLADLSQVPFSIVSNVWGKGGQALISQSAY